MFTAKMGFVYRFECFRDGRRRWTEIVHNLLPDESVEYIMTASLYGGAQYSSWYIGLFENSHTPAGTDTMTTVVNTAGESEAYSGTNRLLMSPNTLADGVFSDSSDPAEFTFTSGATIRGGFITSNILRASTSGLLLSVVALPSPQTLAIGDILRVTSGFSLTAV